MLVMALPCSSTLKHQINIETRARNRWTTVIDIHTHIYPPSYLSLLRSRSTVPYLLDFPDKSSPPRLIILPSDDDASIPPESRRRLIDTSYSSITEKLRFMEIHQITTSATTEFLIVFECRICSAGMRFRARNCQTIKGSSTLIF